jgi:ATP-dependent DNA ligase
MPPCRCDAYKLNMTLPLAVPYPPMEAETADEIPVGEQWQYEPKWDGFRCIVLRDGDSIGLQSKAGKSLTRYFPEVVAAVRNMPPKQFVLDGELAIPAEGGLSFEDLLQRVHPAASRVDKLAREHPAQLIVFDLLTDDQGEPLVDTPLSHRRPMLEAFARKYFSTSDTIRLSPATRRIETARGWLRAVGSGLDGIIAKRLDVAYASGQRSGMIKVKRIRTADCVVGGFRYGANSRQVGSLLLGLYNQQGLLHHVGFTSGIKDADRADLTRQLEALIQPPGFTGRSPGGPSRWSTDRSGEWQPLAPELVVEVQYDHFSGGRFRHGTKLCRWRPDKDPAQCTMDQLGGKSRSPIVLLQ